MSIRSARDYTGVAEKLHLLVCGSSTRRTERQTERERERERLKIPAGEKDRADRQTPFVPAMPFARLPLRRYNTIVNREGRAREGRA